MNLLRTLQSSRHLLESTLMRLLIDCVNEWRFRYLHCNGQQGIGETKPSPRRVDSKRALVTAVTSKAIIVFESLQSREVQ